MERCTTNVPGCHYAFERDSDNLKSHAAHQVHSTLQKSRTLNRRYVVNDMKREPATPAHQPIITRSVRHQATPTPLITRSEAITRFAKQKVAAQPQPGRVIQDFGPAPHPIAQKVHQRTAPVKTHAVVRPSQIIKQEAIHQAMQKAPAKQATKQVKTPGDRNRFSQALSIASASFALLLLGGYLTYLNMPAISTRVAASQAGINASYPAYRPSGYSLNGPVAYQHGTVTMKFAANAGPQNYTLTQTRSGWDSSAVLDNYVSPKAGDNYTTATTNGLTIYTYGKNAAWVNGGILYTISGDAPLSGEQVQNIATSL